MASIRSKCSTNTSLLHNNNNNNINNNNNNCRKSYVKTSPDLICCGREREPPPSRPQLRWSQSFSPTDRQKPNVSTLIRRKSAVERLAESKYNYIKCSSADRDVIITATPDENIHHNYIHKSLSNGKTPLVIVSQSPPIFMANITNNITNNCHNNHIQSHNQYVNSEQSVHQTSAATTGQTTAGRTADLYTAQPVVTRKRNSSLSSRLSDASNNLEIQLRQLIGDNVCDSSDQKNATTDAKPKRKGSGDISVSSTSPVNVKVAESPPKPKPKERITTNTTNSNSQQIVRQSVATNHRNVTSNKTIDTKTSAKTNITNNNNKSVIAKNSNSSPPLRPISSHKYSTNGNHNMITGTSVKTLQTVPKPSAQSLLQPKTRPKPTMPLRPTTITIEPKSPTISPSMSGANRQLSISRSKSDVSNRLLGRRNKSKDEIERFFETLGLDSSVWDSIRSEATNSLISTPKHYFDSNDSVPSAVDKDVVKARPVRTCGSSSTSSTSSSSSSSKASSAQSTTGRQTTAAADRVANVLNTRLMQSRSCHTLSTGSSIVEKNARVIKWLYNCRKAMV